MLRPLGEKLGCSLFPVSWTDFNSPVTATNTLMTTQDEINLTNTARFYRVQLLLE